MQPAADEAPITKLPDAVAAELKLLRVELLHTSTIYGLSAAVGTSDAETVSAWAAWLSWMNAHVAAIKLELEKVEAG